MVEHVALCASGIAAEVEISGKRKRKAKAGASASKRKTRAGGGSSAAVRGARTFTRLLEDVSGLLYCRL